MRTFQIIVIQISLFVSLTILFCGCTMTRFPVGGKYFTRVSVFQKVDFSVTDPESGFTVTYGNDGGTELTAGVISAAVAAGIKAAK